MSEIVPQPGVHLGVKNPTEVYARLRDMLMDGEIAPGSIISQVKLARQLGVSTTPLREAMRRLQTEGLLVAEHNQRARVAPMDPRQIETVYASRIMMEALAVRLTVPKVTTEDDAALHVDLLTMKEAADDADSRAWEPIHRAFHRRLISDCDPYLTRAIELLADHSERYRRFSMTGSPARAWAIGNEEHEAIVEARLARRPELASVLLARHYARSALTVLAKIAPDHDPSVIRMALQLVQLSGG